MKPHVVSKHILFFSTFKCSVFALLHFGDGDGDRSGGMGMGVGDGDGDGREGVCRVNVFSTFQLIKRVFRQFNGKNTVVEYWLFTCTNRC